MLFGAGPALTGEKAGETRWGGGVREGRPWGHRTDGNPGNKYTQSSPARLRGAIPRPDWAGRKRHHWESGGGKRRFCGFGHFLFSTVMSVRGSSSLFLCVYRAHPTRLMTGVAGVELGFGSLEHFAFRYFFLGWVVCLHVRKKGRAVIIARETFRDYRFERDWAFAWMAGQ